LNFASGEPRIAGIQQGKGGGEKIGVFSVFTDREKETMNFVDKLKLSVMVFLVLILAIYPSISRAVGPEAEPVVEIPAPRYDAGTHWQGEVVTHTFELKNSGNGELKILRVKPG
jgi:hypothetical protein